MARRLKHAILMAFIAWKWNRDIKRMEKSL